MTRKFFGTDGIRGKSNSWPMTPEVAMRVGMAAGVYFERGDHRHKVVIAKDTRLSGYMVEPALTAGFVASGVDVLLVGPMPTPAVAMLTKSMRADIGVMISASHNPYHDNGIKLFGPDGYKLSDDVEMKIEKLMQESLEGRMAAPDKLGRAKRLDDAPGRYIEFVKSTFPKGKRLDGLKVVIDCANGAAYKIGPLALWELGAEVIAIGVEPDGFNINRDCGSTHPGRLAEEVKRHKADLGIALDGDADRLAMCDENGNIIDGDQLMAMIAAYWHGAGMLKGGGIISTLMSNLGLERHMQKLGLKMIRTKVGDRYVVEAMREHGCNIGGEQSGHIILGDYSTTGDGLVAALQVLAVVIERGEPVSKVSKVFEPLPQVMKNVRCEKGEPLENNNVTEAIKSGEIKLKGTGRLVIRKSGTEPLIRVMGEGEDQSVVANVVNDVAQAIERAVASYG